MTERWCFELDNRHDRNLHDMLAGHPVTWVNTSQLCAGHDTPPARGQAHVDQLVETYKAGRWPPPIVCYRSGEHIVRAGDGNHRHKAALIAGIRRLPIMLFESQDHLIRALERAAETPRDRELRQQHVAAARHWLAGEAAGAARLTQAQRETYRAAVAAADED